MRRHGRRGGGIIVQKDRSFLSGDSRHKVHHGGEGSCMLVAGKGTAEFPGIRLCPSRLRVQRHVLECVCRPGAGSRVPATADFACCRTWLRHTLGKSGAHRGAGSTRLSVNFATSSAGKEGKADGEAGMGVFRLCIWSRLAVAREDKAAGGLSSTKFDV